MYASTHTHTTHAYGCLHFVCVLHVECVCVCTCDAIKVVFAGGFCCVDEPVAEGVLVIW